MTTPYTAFLAAKAVTAPATGLTVDAAAVAPFLRAASGWADVAAWWAVRRPVPAPPEVGG
jgi:hypothetical protein